MLGLAARIRLVVTYGDGLRAITTGVKVGLPRFSTTP